MSEGRLLLIEDDVRLGTLVADYLQKAGFMVEVERDGRRGRQRLLEQPPDLLILDLLLPGEDGLSICRAVRPHFRGPILMLTAQGEELDQVLGLELGADDYLAKPASPRLLLAKIRALLRRPATTPVNRVEDRLLSIDSGRREVRARGQVLELTTAEFDLLWCLASRAGRPVDRQTLFTELRGIDYDGLDRSMDVRLSQLRKKLEDFTGDPDLIKTVRGTGYQYTGGA